jgi:hypothetical protein
VAFTGAPPAIEWQLYSGPGTVTFGSAAQTNTTATFSAPGVYTLMLSADDSIHAVAYAAVVITVVPGIWMTIAGAGTSVNLGWTGGSPPYVLQQSTAFPANAWSGVITTSVQNATLPMTTNSNAFFRVQGQ